jgi:hypothetical protein
MPRGIYHRKTKRLKPHCLKCGIELANYNAIHCIKHRKRDRKWKLSLETRQKMSKSRRGEKNWRWVKDRTQLVKSSHKHLDGNYREWASGVKKRDRWKCRLLSSDCSGRLESHHIFNWKEYPELRYLINNGITLCHAHHPRGRAEEKRMIPIFVELLSVSKE